MSGCSSYGPSKFARARHRDRVAPARAALGGQQVVVAVALVEVRAFGEADRRAPKIRCSLADQLAFCGGIFLQDDSGETIVPGPVVPEHVQTDICGRRRRETAKDRSRCY